MNRKLKVYGNENIDHSGVPFILLKGKWLKDIGFSIGNCIDVECINGTIVITKK